MTKRELLRWLRPLPDNAAIFLSDYISDSRYEVYGCRAFTALDYGSLTLPLGLKRVA